VIFFDSSLKSILGQKFRFNEENNFGS